MSSVDFSGEIWPWELSTGTTVERVIIWVLVVWSMALMFPLTVYHAHCLFPDLRRRDLQLLIGVVVVVAMDFLVVEPLHLLCGAFTPSISIASGFYLTLSAISYHVLVYSLLLRVWTFWFDTKWLDICCIAGDQWRHHILDSKTKKITNSPNGGNTSTPDHDAGGSAETPTPTPNDSEISWFVRHREHYGSVAFAAKICALCATVSIALHLPAFVALSGSGRAVALYIVDGVPVVAICCFWAAMPNISDFGALSGRRWWRYFLIVVAAAEIADIAMKGVVAGTDSLSLQHILSMLSMAVHLIAVSAATLCLLWLPRRSRSRESLQIHPSAVDGERAQSMSFQIEMTDGKNLKNTETVDREDIAAVFADQKQLASFLRHCAREFSVENAFAMMEMLQFRAYCTAQRQHIEEQQVLRKKTAKIRYQRKKHSIHRKKQRRTQRLSMANGQSQDLDDDELIQLEIAQKAPIETEVTSSLNMIGGMGREESVSSRAYVGDDEEEETVYGAPKEAEHPPGFAAIGDWNHIPRSSIIHRPFVVNSRTKRIEQLEAIIVALCAKYVDRGSFFALSLPDGVADALRESTRKMGGKHAARRGRAPNAMDSGSPSPPPPDSTLGLNVRATVALYPEGHEEELPAFFDQAMDCVLCSLSKSLRRFRHCEHSQRTRGGQ